MLSQTQVPGWLGPTLHDADAELALLAIERGKRTQLSVLADARRPSSVKWLWAARHLLRKYSGCSLYRAHDPCIFYDIPQGEFSQVRWGDLGGCSQTSLIGGDSGNLVMTHTRKRQLFRSIY